jgi:hypothetical protein
MTGRTVAYEVRDGGMFGAAATGERDDRVHHSGQDVR